MSNTSTLRSGAGTRELDRLLTQLAEKKSQVELLLVRVDQVLRGERASDKVVRPANSGSTGVAPARSSPLDRAKGVLKVTEDLREANGNLSAARVAKVFGVSLSQLAGWLGRTKQAVSKTPDADSLQDALGYFERVARLRLLTEGDAGFRKWLRTPHPDVVGKNPLALLASGEWQAAADFVESILTGTPG